jgi:hypothetical protein
LPAPKAQTLRLPTGNDAVALPSVDSASAAVHGISVLMRKFRGQVELGGGDEPLAEPWLSIGGKAVHLAKAKGLALSREENWVPSFALSDPKAWSLALRVLAPSGERGFVFDFCLKNLGKKKLAAQLGGQGALSYCGLRFAEAHALGLERSGLHHQSSHGQHLVLSLSSAMPELALAIGASEGLDVAELGTAALKGAGAFSAGKRVEAGDKPLRWSAARKLSLEPGAEARVTLAFGLGLDAAGAAAAAAEMLRQGGERLAERTMVFLAQRRRTTGDAGLDALLNSNLLFNYFYGMGTPLDGEDLVCLASRDPLAPEAGVYRDRDAMLRSFPSVLLVDQRRARQMLEYALLTQGRNQGVRSSYLDGSTLEPTFELDQLCAPIIALASYTRHTGDTTLANDHQVRKLLRNLERLLQARKNPSAFLYETAFGPGGEAESLPVLTYDNVLVWRMLCDLAEVKDKSGREQEARTHREHSEKVRAAIWQHLVAEGSRGRTFVWASDLRGSTRPGTDPAGCLQLLPYWGFCQMEDPVWRATVAYVRSRDFQHSHAGAAFEEIGSPRLGQPSLLGLCNSLLSGHREAAVAVLRRLPLRQGLAGEGFSAKDGQPLGGPALAGSAGFLAWSLWRACGKAAV